MPAGDVGVRVDGSKELVALSDGFRESSESWADLLRDCSAADARPEAGRRRRRARVLEGAARGIPRHPRAALLVTQARQRPCCAAEVQRTPARRPHSRRSTNAKDKDRAHARRCEEHSPTTTAQVAQGRRQGPRRPRRAPRVLRLPRRALDPPAHHEPDRVHLRHRPAPATRHQGTRLHSSRHRDGVELIESAQRRWRAVNAPHLVALVRAGATSRTACS